MDGVERGVLWDSCLAPGGERRIVLVTRSGERIGELTLTAAAEGREAELTRHLTACLDILDPEPWHTTEGNGSRAGLRLVT